MTALLAIVTLPPARDMALFAPELTLMAAVAAVLLLATFLPRRRLVAAVVSAVGAFAACAIAICIYVFGRESQGFLGAAFSGLVVADGLSCFLRALIYGFLGLICVMWLITASRRPGDESAAHPAEFFVLLLSAAVGMGFMVSTRNLLMMIISLELASLPSYALAGFRKHNRRSAEAALKYAIFGASTSAIMLYGISLLYGLYGTLDVGEIGLHLQQGAAGWIGLVGLLAGVGFKISAVPFHFWCPDVFEGASVEVATFLSVPSKAAGLTLLIRLAMSLGGFAEGAAQAPGTSTIALAIGILAAVTATIGNLSALGQNNLKRLLAYSSIAHAGYMLMAGAILSGTSGASAIMMYLLVYLLMNLGAFSVVAIVYNRTGSEQISALAGLGRRAPLLAVCMALFMLSLVGLPPLAGFFAKYQLFYSLFMFQPYSLRWLVVVALLNTLVSLFYYLRVVRAMFLDASTEPPLVVGRVAQGWVLALAVPVTLLPVVWEPLSRVASFFCSGLVLAR
jgi:NADH-quinone oxidoreductase subunit N